MSEQLPFRREDAADLARPRYGNSNPDSTSNRFWEWMIRERRPAYWARQKLALGGASCPRGHADQSLARDDPEGPVWCFTRFGRTITQLPFETVYIGGEHEDFYDPDFCIYNDVVVEDANGEIQIFSYPKELFPPTDFHSATLLEGHIWLIGSLGYLDLRRDGYTQVFRLETTTCRIERIETSGDNPGWISRHQAGSDPCGREVWVRGGQVWNAIDGSLIPNAATYALSLGSLTWRRLS